MRFSRTMPNGCICLVLEVCAVDVLFVLGLLVNLEAFLTVGVDEQAPTGPGEEEPLGASVTSSYRIIMRATVPDTGTVPLGLRSVCQRAYTSGLQFRV